MRLRQFRLEDFYVIGAVGFEGAETGLRGCKAGLVSGHSRV